MNAKRLPLHNSEGGADDHFQAIHLERPRNSGWIETVASIFEPLAISLIEKSSISANKHVEAIQNLRVFCSQFPACPDASGRIFQFWWCLFSILPIQSSANRDLKSREDIKCDYWGTGGASQTQALPIISSARACESFACWLRILQMRMPETLR